MLGRLIVIAAVLTTATTAVCLAQPRPLTIAATTSVEDSGLFQYLTLKFTERTGVPVRVLSRASALALLTAEKGEVDLIIVNDAAAIDRFAQRSTGLQRRNLMHNDFVIAGPAPDPAGVRSAPNSAAALRAIARVRAPFVSRGDESGTHVAEQRLWKLAGVNPKARSGKWFRETGAGMGESLRLAAKEQAYILVDRGTWIGAADKGALALLNEGDAQLFNQYEVVLVRRSTDAGARQDDATKLFQWLISAEGQDAIGAFQIGNKQLFTPDANVPVPKAAAQ
jgi:tungstate transport system substrate-binding protein